MTNPTPSLAQVIAQIRLEYKQPDMGGLQRVYTYRLQEWAAALARLEPLVAAAEAYSRAPLGNDTKAWRYARGALTDAALALFAKGESGG